jgi:hypothetical protein
MSGMMAKLNSDGAIHTWKWTCVGRRDVGSANGRNEGMRAGGFRGSRGRGVGFESSGRESAAWTSRELSVGGSPWYYIYQCKNKK